MRKQRVSDGSEGHKMPDRLQEIRARLDLAGTFSVDGPDNSHFIAHTPADIAWLLDEVERLERENAYDLLEITRKASDAEDYWMQEAKRLRAYAVHKHNDCWQHGYCVCGLDEPVVQGVTKQERGA